MSSQKVSCTGEEIRKEEEQYLSHVLKRIPQRIAEIEAKIEETDKSEYLDAVVKRQVTRGMDRERERIRAIGDAAPYFGRFSLQALDNHPDTPSGTFYVGRAPLEKAPGDDTVTGDYLVLDHREEICTLYYRQSRPGMVSYRPHKETFRVLFQEKRQMQIDAGKLVSVYDGEGRRLDAVSPPSAKPSAAPAASAATETSLSPVMLSPKGAEVGTESDEVDPAVTWRDPFLAEVLAGRHASGRLGDIVQTIQAEQDEVIRSSADVLVVQGPAGSGKTISALQRAAQLLYDRRKRRRDILSRRGGYDALDEDPAMISAQQMLVLSPNAIFSDYISRVLPDLNEGEIRQEIFEDLIRNALSRRLRPLPFETGKARRLWRIEKRRDRYEAILDSAPDTPREEAAAFKSSAAILDLLEAFVTAQTETLETAAFPADIRSNDYHSGDEESEPGVFFGTEALRRRFRAGVTRGEVPAVALEAVVAAVRERQAAYGERRFVGEGVKARLARAVTAFEATVHAATSEHLRRPLPELYRAFWKSVQGKPGTKPGVITAAAEQTLSVLEGETAVIPSEDVVPMLILDGLLNGFGTGLSWAEHAIVDEGQDYSPLHFEYLRRVLPSGCGLTIVGDVNQGIDAALSLQDWERLTPVFRSRLERTELVRSYRSSQEITDLASAVLGDGSKIENVRRTGRLPRLEILPEIKADRARVAAAAAAVAQAVRELLEGGHQSVGVICRTRAEVVRVVRRLEALGTAATPLTDQTRTLSGDAGVLVAPLYLAKGLEFDAVVVADVSAASYGRESDRRALYTACTRPLHDLVLIHAGGPGSALSPLLPATESGLYSLEVVALTSAPDEEPESDEESENTEEVPVEDNTDLEVLEMTEETVASAGIPPLAGEGTATLPLLATLPLHRLRAVLKQAYGEREKLPAPLRTWLGDLVKPVSGFGRQPLMAPFRSVELKLVRAVGTGDPQILWRLLALWRLSEADLEDSVRSFLAGIGVPTVPKGEVIVTDGNAPYSREQMEAWAATLLGRGDEMAEGAETFESACLMVCALALPAVSTEEEGAEKVTETTAEIEALLAPWKALGPESAAWDAAEMESFLGRLNTLAAERRGARAEILEAKGLLAGALECLRTEQATGLEEFEIGIAGWGSESLVTPDTLVTAAEQAEALRVALAAYNEIDIRSVPVAERPALRQRQDSLEAEIRSLGMQLEALLGTGE